MLLYFSQILCDLNCGDGDILPQPCGWLTNHAAAFILLTVRFLYQSRSDAPSISRKDPSSTSEGIQGRRSPSVVVQRSENICTQVHGSCGVFDSEACHCASFLSSCSALGLGASSTVSSLISLALSIGRGQFTNVPSRLCVVPEAPQSCAPGS